MPSFPYFAGPATLPSVNFRDFRDEVPSRQSELSVSLTQLPLNTHDEDMISLYWFVC